MSILNLRPMVVEQEAVRAQLAAVWFDRADVLLLVLVDISGGKR